MIDFNLSLIEAGGGLVVRASSEQLGEAYSFPTGEDSAGLNQIQRQVEHLLKARSLDGEFVLLGQHLFSHIFMDDVRDLYQKACALSEDSRHGPLLVLLRIGPESKLQEVPWEILHDGKRVLARDPRVTVVRYFEQPVPVESLEVEPPVRVLLTTANPKDLHCLALDREVNLIRLAYEEAGPLVDLKVEEGVSLEKLEKIWRRASACRKPFHVWHHCGHGGAVRVDESREFRLFLEKDCMKESIALEQLEDIVSFCPELRIAILNVCQAGSALGLAPALARLRVPVVIGFKHSVSDSSALRFAAALHDALLYMPVEMAVNSARRSMKINHPDKFDWNHALVISRRKDRGGLLKPREERSQGLEQGKRRPKASRSSVNVDMKIGKVKAEDFAAIGTQVVGNASADTGQNTKIQMSVDQVEAIRVRQIGYQALGGFSGEDIQRQEERLVKLVEKVDRYLREGD